MTRRTFLAIVAVVVASGVSAEITGARYIEPTDDYGHGAVAGGEYAGLEVRLGPDRILTVTTPDAVFEDTAPRLVDLNGDGSAEVVVVLSDFDRGAALQIFAEVPATAGLHPTTIMQVAQTRAIGQRFRWLAIAAIGDLDGDGRTEIAYVDRPHLAKILRIVEVHEKAGVWTLVPVAQAPNLTNHRLGSPRIEGGMRTCDGPEIITANGDWTRIIATRWTGAALVSRDLGAYSGADSLIAAMAC